MAHRTMAQLQEGLEHILASPSDNGTLEMIVVRPDSGSRETPDRCEISLAGGVHGDYWIRKTHVHTDDGQSHPDVQICMMNARCIDAIAQSRDNWSPAGDNFFLDLDLSPENLPVGQRLGIGTAVIEITAEPHLGCGSFARRYGPDAVKFGNDEYGKSKRLRGVYARVVQDGRVSVGDTVSKL